MDKQILLEVVLSSSVSRAEKGEDLREEALCTALLTNCALYYLRPDWFQNDRIDSEFKKLENTLSRYYEKKQAASEFAEIAEECGLSLPTTEEDVVKVENGPSVRIWHGLVDPSLLGMCFSEDPKDQQFIRSTVTRYIKKVFPNMKRNVELFMSERSREAAKLTAPVLAANMPLTSGPFPAAQSIEPNQDLPLDRSCVELDKELFRYAVILLGEIKYFDLMKEDCRWQYIERDDGTRVVDPDSVFARQAACLRPDMHVCTACQPEFRELMTTIYYVRNSGLPIEPLTKRSDLEKDRYYKAAQRTVAPFAELMRVKDIQKAKADGELLSKTVAFAEEYQKQEDRIASLQAELDEARQAKKAGPSAQELDDLKEDAARAKRKADAAAAHLERVKEDMSKLEKKNAELALALKERGAAYDDLNEQFIASLEEQDDFLDDDEFSDLDESPTLAGVRERIGEEAYQKLAGKRLAIVGGHENTQRVLRSLFPDWRFYAIDELLPDTLSSVDAIAVLSRYVSHKSYQQAKSTAKNTGIPLVLANHNGPTSICRTLAAQIV